VGEVPRREGKKKTGSTARAGVVVTFSLTNDNFSYRKGDKNKKMQGFRGGENKREKKEKKGGGKKEKGAGRT